MKKFEDFFFKERQKKTKHPEQTKKTQTKTKVMIFFYQGKVEGLCKSSGCQVLPQQLCQFIKWELWTNT